MKAHVGNAAVQEQGCTALRKFAIAAENEPKVAAAGGIEAVVAAMKAHAGVAAVQDNGCWALLNIAWSSAEIQARVVAAGGLMAAEEAMRRHPSDTDIQQAGGKLKAKLQQATMNLRAAEDPISNAVRTFEGKTLIILSLT